MGVFRGVVIEESLSTPDCFELIRVRRRREIEAGDPDAGQPRRWTIVDFDVAADKADVLAHKLSADLESGPWYVDFDDGHRYYVVFAGRVFVHDRGDTDTLERARAYAESVGVPPAQIDWDGLNPG